MTGQGGFECIVCGKKHYDRIVSGYREVTQEDVKEAKRHGRERIARDALGKSGTFCNNHLTIRPSINQ